MENKFKFKTEDGIRLEGNIIYANTDGICVKLTYPYLGWENHTSFNGPMRRNIKNYLKNNKIKIIKRLLNETFQKLEIIDESLDRNIRLYNSYLDELSVINSLEESETKDRIKSKLEDWLFGNGLFTSSVTGISAAYSERPEIEEIFINYKKNGIKIYK